MSHVRRKLILTGAHAGKTIQLGNFQFVNGATVVEGAANDVEGKCTYLGRCYKAWPDGSLELQHFQRLDQEREAKRHGAGKANETAQQGHTGALPGGVQSDGRGSPPIPPDNGQGAAPDSSGAAGSVSNGNGQQDAGDSDTGWRTGRLGEAVRGLDPDNDEHWTADGRPRMDAVEAAFGSADVNRVDVQQAAPGFDREVARAAKAK